MSERRFPRREFMKRTASAGAAVLAAGVPLFPSPLVLTKPRSSTLSARGNVAFTAPSVQRGRGPHLLDWAYATDFRGDSFPTDIVAAKEGVTLGGALPEERFAVNVRWNVEGFGYLFLTADNGGEFYELPSEGKTTRFDLAVELAKSRVTRNRARWRQFGKEGLKASKELETLISLSNELYEDSTRASRNAEGRSAFAQRSLMYALQASELLELERARHAIGNMGPRPGFYYGCDARAFYQIYQDRFLTLFSELFNYAMVTFVIKGDGMMSDFEPTEGRLNFATRDVLIRKLIDRGITVQGRTLFWFYNGVTPDWLKSKSYDDLRRYVERHTRDTIAHYPDGIYGWEIFNEFHDWAMEVNVTQEQTVDLVKLACDVARDTNPKAKRIINNCCPFAEYVQLKKTSGRPVSFRQRTPWQFTRDLVDAGVDFTHIGQQMYFPFRDLQDIMIGLERYQAFGKPVQLSEVGAPGGLRNETVLSRDAKLPTDPYVWHRPWDEELQADWLESVATLAVSRPWIESFSWFDLIDRGAFQQNGGLLRTEEGEKKAAWHRFANLQQRLRTPA